MKKILLIEDEELVRRAICHLLRHMEFEPLEASDGNTGIRLASEQKPDLILCDVNMPGIDGHSVLKALRGNPSTSSIPFIFLTGQGEKEEVRKGMNLGADDYLAKPVPMEELRNAISVRLNRHAEITQHYAHELQAVEEKMKRLVYYDPLTELPNRMLISEMMQNILDKGTTEIGVLCLTLDRFKRVNTLGFYEGDFMLTLLAERLRKYLNFQNVIARISQDEFAILVNGSKQESAVIARGILKCVETPFPLQTHKVFLTGSIGIALYPDDGGQIDQLLKKASTAAEQATKNGGNQVVFSLDCPDINPVENLFLESQLRLAIERSELEVYYQPQINMSSGRIVGAEALMRWNHPEKGMIPPSTFIQMAEESGLILQMGEWILRKACMRMKQWNSESELQYRVAVNLSGYQFNRPDLIERLSAILNDAAVDPQILELEITESVLIQQPENALRRMKELKDLGVRISLDDFGTGYSSFAYLKQFPFDVLKIDRSFIANVHDDPKSSAIVTAIIQMAHSMNTKIIAEGVETMHEYEFLKQHGCEEVQGYLFSPPLPEEQFHELMNKTYAFSN